MSERHVRGLAELQKMLDTVTPKLEANIMRGGLRAGVSVMKPVAQSNISSKSGELARSLKVGTRLRWGRATASLYSKDFRARFVEYGTKPHTITAANRRGLSIGGLFFQSVRHPGARAIGFMRNALDTQAQAAVTAVAHYVRARLTKEGLNAAHINLEGDE